MMSQCDNLEESMNDKGQSLTFCWGKTTLVSKSFKTNFLKEEEINNHSDKTLKFIEDEFENNLFLFMNILEDESGWGINKIKIFDHNKSKMPSDYKFKKMFKNRFIWGWISIFG